MLNRNKEWRGSLKRQSTTLLAAALLLSSFTSCGTQTPSAAGNASSESMATAQSTSSNRDPASATEFFLLSSGNPFKVDQALKKIEDGWHPGAATMLIELNRYIGGSSKPKMIQLIEKKTGQSFGGDNDKWNEWIWNQKYDPHPEYAEFKRNLYTSLDRSFSEYFQVTDNARIRLDQIRWGGVARDGIPPLKNPKMISAKEATYLADSNVVFGISINGDHRCYPKRILAWHEMFKDTIGGESVCGVY